VAAALGQCPRPPTIPRPPTASPPTPVSTVHPKRVAPCTGEGTGATVVAVVAVVAVVVLGIPPLLQLRGSSRVVGSDRKVPPRRGNDLDPLQTGGRGDTRRDASSCLATVTAVGGGGGERTKFGVE
jgi:hypothetical protein